MSVPKLAASLLFVFPTLACDLSGSDDGDSAGDAGTTSGSAAPTTSGEPADDSTGSGGSAGSDDAVDDSGTSDDGATTGDPPASDCAEATLRLGNPYYDGDIGGWNPAGQGVLDDPPLRSRHLSAVEGQLAIETQFEIWLADDTQVRRIAGDEGELEEQYNPTGPCADVRLLVGSGIATLPNGNLVVVDTRGNGVIELSDPLGTCMAAPIAGNPDLTFDVDISDGPAASGDIDGPGAQARFSGVARPTADPEGNLYVVDLGNTKIKRIAGDADRTVSTLYDSAGDEVLLGFTVLDGLLYVTGTNAIDDFVWSIDPETGTREVLFQGRGLFEELEASQQATMFGLTNDGVDLIVASNKGYVFRLSRMAEPLETIAGIGQIVDYPADLDLTMPIPTGELPIRSYAINDAGLLRMGDDLLFTGSDGGVGFHVWSIHCQ